MSKIQQRLIKSLIKKSSVPKEKQEEVIKAFNSLDLNVLLKNPQALSEVIQDHSKLNDYVVEEAKEQ